MNFSWIAYERGLQQLLQRIPQNHPAYDNVCTLQTCLQQNIAHAKLHGDTDALRMVRKRIIADLESVTRQVTEDGFMQLCRANCGLFKYLAHVYETAYYACDVFGGERVWPDQCQRIVKDFGKRPALAEAEREVTDGTRTALYYLDDRVTKLMQLIEEYKRSSKLPNRRIRNKHEEVIRQLDILIEEMQQIDHASFKELIAWYQEAILSVNAPQTSPAPDLLDGNTLLPAPTESQQQDQELSQQPIHQHKEEPSQQPKEQRRKEPAQQVTSHEEGSVQQAMHQHKDEPSQETPM